MILHITVIFHSAADLRLAGLQNSQPHQTIVQQDGISRFDVTGQFSVGNGTAVRIALHLNGGQGEFLTGGQMDPSTGKVLQTNLRALGIQHGRHRGVQFFPQRLQRVQPRRDRQRAPLGEEPLLRLELFQNFKDSFLRLFVKIRNGLPIHSSASFIGLYLFPGFC